jgi:hypothetical protein
MTDFLALLNDILQSIIIIFGTAVVLYNLSRVRRDRVTRAFIALITFVIISFLAEILVSRALIPISAEILLQLQWIGIAMVPAAQYHLSDALLTTTGAISRRRRLLVRVGYISGIVLVVLVLTTPYLVYPPNNLITTDVPHLLAGPLFPLFAFYFWLVAAVSIYQVWRARKRCLTRTTRQRMTTTLIAFIAAPLAVFPYLSMSRGTALAHGLPVWLWIIIIMGNLLVGLLFGVLTAQLIYFGAASPDRVVRVRLFKFMARVPMAASIVLIVYVLVGRSSVVLGLPEETMTAIAVVATMMIVEWAIHAYKQPLERMFHLNSDPDVRRIQELSERLLTTSDLHQYLDSILAAACEAVRTPTAFVAAMTADGPQLEAVVGPLTDYELLLHHADWLELTRSVHDDLPDEDHDLHMVDEFILWQGYWIRPLHSSKTDTFLGIFGIRGRAEKPDLNDAEMHTLDNLQDQVTSALEDRILQQEVFAAVEGLLPQITELQKRRSQATFGGLPVLTAPVISDEILVDNPEFNSMVRDALRDYWGGPKLTKSPLMRLEIVKRSMDENENNPTKALRAILNDAIELQKPEGERSLTTGEWILYNILELKFVQGQRVRDVARRLAMSESDLYRKQRVALENVARTIADMEKEARGLPVSPTPILVEESLLAESVEE